MTVVEWAQLLGSLGEFVGAIAVVITLLYLVKQVRQNTAGLRASAHQTWVAATTAHYGAPQTNPALGSAILQGLLDPAGLGEDDWLQFAFWCHQFILITEATFYLHQEGIISNSVFEKEIQRATAFIESDGGAQWWAAGGRTQFSDDFVQELESADTDGSSFQRYLFAPGRGFYPMPPAEDQAE